MNFPGFVAASKQLYIVLTIHGLSDELGTCLEFRVGLKGVPCACQQVTMLALVHKLTLTFKHVIVSQDVKPLGKELPLDKIALKITLAANE